MKLFKYNTVLLLMMFGGLVGAGMAYATPSAPTPGPSVGHRPVLKNLGMSSIGDTQDATKPSTGLTPGIELTMGGLGRFDKDGDPVTYTNAWTCNWYRVPMDGTAETQIKSSICYPEGMNWVIQSADIGFKLKLEVLYRSDQAAASAAGYTVNPVEALPISIVTANPVSAATYFSGITVNGKTLPAKDGFPITAFGGAKFKLNVADGTPNDYIWRTMGSQSISVTPEGEVVFLANKKIANQRVEVFAKSKKTNIEHIYRLHPKKWFTNTGSAILSNLSEVEYNQACVSSSHLAGLPHATDDFAPLVSEWGVVNESNYPGSGFYTTVPNHPMVYYAAKSSKLTGVHLGDGSQTPNPSGYLLACVINLQ